jgi:Fe-S-cluster containining protein
VSPEFERTTLLRTPFHLARSSPFSYECKACKRCCQSKRIPVNPYEVARLAGHLGQSTTAFLAAHTEIGGAILRRRDDDTCVFLGEGGCTVHSARPLACRLYPLGRQRTPDAHERFAELQPHPRSEGVYGDAGTVDGYLATQEVAHHLQMGDRYGAILVRMLGALAKLEGGREAQAQAVDAMGQPSPTGDDNVLDLDATIAAYCAEKGRAVPDDLEEKVALHLEALEAFVAGLEAS